MNSPPLYPRPVQVRRDEWINGWLQIFPLTAAHTIHNIYIHLPKPTTKTHTSHTNTNTKNRRRTRSSPRPCTHWIRCTRRLTPGKHTTKHTHTHRPHLTNLASRPAMAAAVISVAVGGVMEGVAPAVPSSPNPIGPRPAVQPNPNPNRIV